MESSEEFADGVALYRFEKTGSCILHVLASGGRDLIKGNVWVSPHTISCCVVYAAFYWYPVSFTLKDDDMMYFYPLALQPLCHHLIPY